MASAAGLPPVFRKFQASRKDGILENGGPQSRPTGGIEPHCG